MVQVNTLRAAMNLFSFGICWRRQQKDPRAAARPPCRHPPQGDLMDGKCVHISIFFTGNLPGHPEAGPCQGEPNGDNHRLPPPVHARRRRGWVASWPSAVPSLWLEQATQRQLPAVKARRHVHSTETDQSSLVHFVSVPCVLPQTSCSGQWRATNAARRRTSSRQLSNCTPPGSSCDTLMIRSSSPYSPAAAGGGARRVRQRRHLSKTSWWFHLPVFHDSLRSYTQTSCSGRWSATNTARRRT